MSIFQGIYNLIVIIAIIVIAIYEIKNSSFFRSTPYTDEEKAVEEKFGRIIGKLYHWFI